MLTIYENIQVIDLIIELFTLFYFLPGVKLDQDCNKQNAYISLLFVFYFIIRIYIKEMLALNSPRY